MIANVGRVVTTVNRIIDRQSKRSNVLLGVAMANNGARMGADDRIALHRNRARCFQIALPFCPFSYTTEFLHRSVLSFHYVFLFGQMWIMIELNWIDMSVHSLVDVHESAVSSFGRLWASINCLSISNVQVYIALFAVLVFELVTVEFSAHKLTFLFWIRAISVSTCPVDVFDSHERIGNEALFKDYERVHWPTLT